MIQLTRLNNHPITVNSDLIKLVEQAPDTVITLINGEKIIVRESAEEVLNKVVEFRRAVLQGLSPLWSSIPISPSPPLQELPAEDEAWDDSDAPEER